MATPRELLNAAKAEIREIDAAEVASRLDHFQLLDVREPDEYEQGAVPGALANLDEVAKSPQFVIPVQVRIQLFQ